MHSKDPVRIDVSGKYDQQASMAKKHDQEAVADFAQHSQ